jgi:RNA polymerase sigma-70 factor (ECF subfamily)
MTAAPPAPSPEIRDALLAAVPSLRAFGISLCGNVDRADDLVQDTLVRALTHINSFEPGTNLNAWLFTILRNLFHSEYRKRRREVEDVDGVYSGRLATQPSQHAHLDFGDFREALNKLPPDQREALLLVGASGFSYEEAAEICQCAVGTIKSRVNRARVRLAGLLAVEEGADLGVDGTLRAALQAAS